MTKETVEANLSSFHPIEHCFFCTYYYGRSGKVWASGVNKFISEGKYRIVR